MKIRKTIAAGVKAAFALAVLHWCGRLMILRVEGHGSVVPMGTRFGMPVTDTLHFIACMAVELDGRTPVLVRVVRVQPLTLEMLVCPERGHDDHLDACRRGWL